MNVDPDTLVRRRPHFGRHGTEVRFLISRHPALTLTESQIPLFDALEKGITWREAAASGSGDLLREWHRAEIVELIPPQPTSGRPLVAIEPHMDDVALSIGGRLLLRRGKQPIVIVSGTRRSNVSCYWSLGRDFFDAERVTALRIAESELAAAVAGATLRSIDRADAPLRFQPAERWNAKTFVVTHDALAPFIGFAPTRDEARDLAAHLADEVVPLDPAELWIPLGLGGHIDHRLTRDASLMMVAAHWDRFAAIPILLYEDHPYSVYFPDQLAQVVRAFAARGVRLTPDVVDIDAVFDEKIRLVSVYASQFKGRAMEPNLRKRAEEAGGGGMLGERAQRLESRPALPPESELAPNAAELGALAAEVQPWLARRRRIRRLAVICGAALGPWPAIERILTEAFPLAEIVLYVRRAQRWETDRTAHPRIRIRPMTSLARESPRIGTPTIIVRFPPWRIADRWREQILKTPLPPSRRKLHALLGAMLPLRPKIFCRHLGDVASVVVEGLGAGGLGIGAGG